MGLDDPDFAATGTLPYSSTTETVYPVTAEPPSLAGARNVSVADPSPRSTESDRTGPGA